MISHVGMEQPRVLQCCLNRVMRVMGGHRELGMTSVLHKKGPSLILLNGMCLSYFWIINHFGFMLAKWSQEASKQPVTVLIEGMSAIMLGKPTHKNFNWMLTQKHSISRECCHTLCMYICTHTYISFFFFDRSIFHYSTSPKPKAWMYLCLSMCENLNQHVTYMCWEAFGKCSAYCGAESSGPWGAAWLMTIMTGRWGYICLDMRKKLMLSFVIRSVK